MGRESDRIVVKAINEESPFLSRVRTLWRANSDTLGFFPKGAFEDYARKKQILVAVSSGETFAGYLMFRCSRERIIIVHLCVAPAFRERDVAKKLVEHLKSTTREFWGIGLKCRRDFDASDMWPKLGFIAQHDKTGKSKDGKELTFWWFDHGHPTLFSGIATQKDNSKLHVVIDANVFYDFFESASQSHESKPLLADWLQGDLEICLTDEIFNEINRHPSSRERTRKRALAESYSRLPCANEEFDLACESLRNFFPKHMKPSDESDMRQLARTIGSGAGFFVTRDNDLLSLAENIYETYGVSIVRPSDLIIHFDELRREVEYRPARLAGTLLRVELIGSGREGALADVFQQSLDGESQNQFKGLLRRYLVKPHNCSCQLVSSVEGRPLALVVYDRTSAHELKIPILRVARGLLVATLARHLVQNSLSISSSERRIATEVTDPFLQQEVCLALQEYQFLNRDRLWSRINLGFAGTAGQLAERLGIVGRSYPELHGFCDDVSAVLMNDSSTRNPKMMSQIERSLWPAKILDADIPTFIVPIRPYWAQHLFDEELARQTLFGAKIELALNCEGVYYRAKKPSGKLKSPGRVLWYVSQDTRYSGTGCIRGCSRLEEIQVDIPKVLFRKYRRLGIYDWKDVYALAKNDVGNRIMAVRFSDTELFKVPVSWEQVQDILIRHKIKTQIQSPVSISKESFSELFLLGTQIEEGK